MLPSVTWAMVQPAQAPQGSCIPMDMKVLLIWRVWVSGSSPKKGPSL